MKDVSNEEFLDLVRVVIGLCPLPTDWGHAKRQTCVECGRKHRNRRFTVCFTCKRKSDHEANS